MRKLLQSKLWCLIVAMAFLQLHLVTVKSINATFNVDMTGQSVTNGVYITGNVNGWKFTALTKVGTSQIYTTTLSLTAGVKQIYYFKNAANWSATTKETVPDACSNSMALWGWAGDRAFYTPANDTIINNYWGACNAPTPIDPNLKDTITVDYGSVLNSACSPMLFGASNAPNREHQASVYPQLGPAGCNLKFQRGTIHIDRLFSANYPNITIDDYKNNVNGCANVENWDWTIASWAVNAKNAGMKTQCNIFYAPAWLTYNNSYDGIPKDWDVYQDIIKKITTHYTQYFDYLEILNEPNGSFVSITNSPYTNKITAITDIYYYTASAIRAVNTTIPIGGEGDHRPGGDFGAIGSILRDSRIPNDWVNFVSWHTYDPNPSVSAQADAMTTLLNSTGHSGTPGFVNEYNYNFTAGTTDPHVIGNQTVSYIGTTLLGFMSQPQIKGAAIYALLPNNVVLDPQEDCIGCTNIAQGLYSWDGTSATMRTTVRAFRLLSGSLRLGEGDFQAYTASGSNQLAKGLGLINSNGETCIALVNTADSIVKTNVRIKNSVSTGTYSYEIFAANADSYTSESPLTTGTCDFSNGSLLIDSINCPPFSILGIRLIAGANACTTPVITPYMKVNDGTAQQTSTITIKPGDKLVLSPQATGEGTWTWSGGDTYGSTQEQVLFPTSPFTATATFTKSCGTKSSQSFTVKQKIGVNLYVDMTGTANENIAQMYVTGTCFNWSFYKMTTVSPRIWKVSFDYVRGTLVNDTAVYYFCTANDWSVASREVVVAPCNRYAGSQRSFTFTFEKPDTTVLFQWGKCEVFNPATYIFTENINAKFTRPLIYLDNQSKTLQVELPTEMEKSCIEIYNIAGVTVKRQILNTPVSVIHTGILSKGVYLAKVYNASYHYTQKIIVN